jgi:hypothetical protein
MNTPFALSKVNTTSAPHSSCIAAARTPFDDAVDDDNVFSHNVVQDGIEAQYVAALRSTFCNIQLPAHSFCNIL